MKTALPFPRYSPNHNHLLAALPHAEYETVAQYLEPVTLALGELLYEPGQHLQHVCFPTTAVVSLYYVTVSGAAAESAGVGNEGVVGISLFMGGNTTSSSAVVQAAGHGYRLDRQRLRQVFDGVGSFRGLLLRYPIPARPHQRGRSQGATDARLRMLRRGQERTGPPAWTRASSMNALGSAPC